MEIIESAVVTSPVTPHHGRTIQKVWNALDTQLGEAWGLLNGVAVSFNEDNEFCPDLAAVPAAEFEKNESVYLPDPVELVVEVVSRGSLRYDYEVKPRWYASRGRDTIPYGPELTLDSPLGKLTIPTAELPVDPKARPQRG